MLEEKRLKAIGYWRIAYLPEAVARYPQLAWAATLPEPQDLADPFWLPDERQNIASYLRSGKKFACANGWACCRLCRPTVELGYCDLSDGEWVWPERLEHYVEQHNLRLPDAFIDTMRRNAWQVRSGPKRPFDDWQEPDYFLWKAWATAVKKDLCQKPL